MSYAQTVTLWTPKMTFWCFWCYRLSIRHFWQDLFYTIPPNMSLEPGLAGFGITSAVERVYRLPAAAARSKMTFAVGRIRKCTLKLKLLVFLFCSPEVGLSYHVKCADRSAPPPNLRVSENRPIVHFETRVQTLLTVLISLLVSGLLWVRSWFCCW